MSRPNQKIKHDPPGGVANLGTGAVGVLPIANGGTGQSTRQNAINALGDASGGTNEHVLTKDTATGNIILKAASGGYWTESATLNYLTTITNKLAIGASALIGTEKVLIKGLTDVIQLIVRGHSTQTANILEIRKSDDTVLFGVSNAAGISVGGTSAVLTPSSGNLAITDASDATKKIAFQASGATTAKTLTLISAHTDDRSITFPNATDTLVGKATTDTLTNKRITKRSAATAGPGATPTINTDTTDVAHFTALATAITSMTTNLSGTPVEGDTLRIDFTDNGTARAITWGTSFEASGTVALPTTTVISTRLDVGFFWNTVTSKWRCVAVA